jgi:hypothetical protein
MMAQDIQSNVQIGSRRYIPLLSQLLQWIVFLYQAGAVVLFIFTLYFANRWLQQPFMGAFYEHTMVFNGTGPAQAELEWSLYSQVEVGEQLLAIDGQAVQDSQSVHDILTIVSR